MGRKIIDLKEGVAAVVEPANAEEYEVAGTRTLIRFKVVEILTTKTFVREEQ